MMETRWKQEKEPEWMKAGDNSGLEVKAFQNQHQILSSHKNTPR